MNIAVRLLSVIVILCFGGYAYLVWDVSAITIFELRDPDFARPAFRLASLLGLYFLSRLLIESLLCHVRTHFLHLRVLLLVADFGMLVASFFLIPDAVWKKLWWQH
jgi:hypothetical protein